MTISQAKFRLYNKSPFFGTIIFNLPVVEITDKKEKAQLLTLGVDGERLYVNMDFWNKHTDKQQLALLCHEVGHLFLGHIWREGHRDAVAVDQTGRQVKVYNLAGDYVINLMVKNHVHTDPTSGQKEKSFDLPKGLLVNDKYINWSTEQVYDDIIKNMKQSKTVISGGICDKSKWKNGKSKGSKGSKQQQAKWKQIGQQALARAKEKGEVPAGMERLFEELEPKEDWRQILLQYVQTYNDDYSFNPVDRRFLDEDFLLPDIAEGQKIDWIAVAVDTSGSIGDKELNAFIGEIKGIIESYDQVKIKLTFCDASATEFVELDEFEKDKIRPKGGGGTDFRPVFNLIKKEQNDPLALLYFTDTYGDFPSKAPLYDTIWIAVTNFGDVKVPWGKLLPYKV